MRKSSPHHSISSFACADILTKGLNCFFPLDQAWNTLVSTMLLPISRVYGCAWRMILEMKFRKPHSSMASLAVGSLDDLAIKAKLSQSRSPFSAFASLPCACTPKNVTFLPSCQEICKQSHSCGELFPEADDTLPICLYMTRINSNGHTAKTGTLSGGYSETVSPGSGCGQWSVVSDVGTPFNGKAKPTPS